MNIKDAYIHNGSGVVKELQVTAAGELQLKRAEKTEQDTYAGWVDVYDLTKVKPTAAGTADKVAHALTFSGGVTGDWDGSEGKTVAIPTKTSWNYDDVYLKLIGGDLTGTLTIGTNSFGSQLTIWRKEPYYSCITFANGTNKDVLGYIGFTYSGDASVGSILPVWVESDTSKKHKLTYVDTNSTTAVGGTTTPVYVDTNGQIKAGTALGTASTHAHSDYVTSIGTSGNTLTWSKGGTAQTAITVPYATNATNTTYAANVGASGTAGTDYVTASNVISMYNWYNTITTTDAASNTAIDKWQEIIDFLSGVTDTSTLSGILAGYSPSGHTHNFLEAYKKESNLGSIADFKKDNDFIYGFAGGDNSCGDKPSGVDAFGVMSFRTASGWYGQVLMASNLASGLYWRTGTSFSGGWKKLIDTVNVSPSLDINNNTIRVSVGGVSSSYITVPYATNADTVDSCNASDFLRVYYGDSYNADTIYTSGVYEVQGGSGVATYGTLLALNYRSHYSGTTPDCGAQIWFSANGNGNVNKMYFRTSGYNTWDPWQEILTREDDFSFVKKDSNYTITFNENQWMNTGDYSTATAVTNQAGWRYTKIAVEKGDRFLIKGRGGYSPVLYAFTDSTNVIKQRAEQALAWEGSYHEIAATQDGYLVVNFNTGYSYDLIPLSWVSGYLNKSKISAGNGISITKDDNGYITITNTKPDIDHNTDTKVKQEAVTYSSYTNWRTIPFGSSNDSSEGFSPSTITEQLFTTTTLKFQPSTGTLRTTVLKSTAASGTAPLIVTSSTMVQNLNANYLNGYNSRYYIPKVTEHIAQGYWYIPAVGSKVTNANVGSTWGFYGKIEVKEGDTFYLKGRGGDDPDLWAWADTTDTIRQISGNQVHYTSYTSITAPQDGYLYYNFNANYDYGIIAESWLPNYIHKANVSPTISASGNNISISVGGISSSELTVPYASSAYSVSSFTGASSESTKRYVWISHDDNSGKSCYWTNFTYQTSTSTLFSTNFDGHLIGSAERISQTSISSLASFTHNADLIYTAAGGSNSVADKPSGVDAFGVLSFKTADGWYGQILTSSNTASGIYWRTGTSFSGGWKQLIDSSNIGSQSVNYATSAGSVSWANVSGKPAVWDVTSNSATSYALSNNTWVDTINLPTDVGSYILCLIAGNSTLTGVFSIGSSDNAKDEISLHLHGNGPRLYARTNNGKLQLSSNYTPTQANPTQSTSVVIKYKRMI